MKPKQLSRTSPNHSALSSSIHVLPHFLNIWHYHKELELVYVKKSVGMKFVGDHLGKFGPGDLFLTGSNLPHLVLNDKQYFAKNADIDGAEAMVLHFDPSFFGQEFLSLPELWMVKNFIGQAKLGFEILANKHEIIHRMSKICEVEGITRITMLLEILDILSMTKEKKSLASSSFVDSYVKNTSTKLDTVYEYLFNNFDQKITLESIAKVANMNPTAFSRFYKKATNKSFKKNLIELRIGYACKKLLEDSFKNVAEICYESGFDSLSSFNKQFKLVTGKTPSQYIEYHNQPNILSA